MNFLTKLERRFGWIAVSNLPVYIVAAQALCYVWMMLNPGQGDLLILDPAAVTAGHEWWRLLTFLFVTPVQNPVFEFFYLYLLYAYGTALENEWGSFPFTLFYFTGAVGTVVSAFFFGSSDGAFYLNTTVFLAFAAIHPNFELLFFFILPVKVKWLAWLTWLYFAYVLLVSPSWTRIGLLISLVNYFLFFGRHHWEEGQAWLASYRHRRRFKDWP